MPLSMTDLLEVVRQVFTGEMTRLQLSRRSPQEQVYAGHAIMLALRDRYLDDNNQVRGVYSHVLTGLLAIGTVNLYAGEEGYRSGNQLAAASKQAKFYTPVPGRGGFKPIVLKLPAELVALVDQLGHTPAIDTFLQDAAKGAEQDKAWADEHNTRLNAQAREAHAWRAIRETEERYGRDGLVELLEKLKTHLAPD
jgi:hypothetical protein